MQKNTFYTIVALLIIFVSCSNGNKNSDNKKTIEDIPNVCSEDSLSQNDTLVLEEVEVEEKVEITSFEVWGVTETLNGKVKSMETIDHIAKKVDGKIVYNENSRFSSYYISFRTDGTTKSHDYYKSSGGTWNENLEYDSIGNPLVRITVSMHGDNDTLSYDILEYDKQGRLTKDSEYSYKTNKLREYRIYKYDSSENSKIIKHYEVGEGILSKRHLYFDDNQNMISSSDYRYKNDEIIKESNTQYSYVLDSFNNWVIEYANCDDKYYGVRIRNFEYYK